MTWASLSTCAKEHNLVAVSLSKIHERHTVCIDPLVGAPCLSLLGGHTAPFLTQVLWSARSAFVLLTAGLVCIFIYNYQSGWSSNVLGYSHTFQTSCRVK